MSLRNDFLELAETLEDVSDEFSEKAEGRISGSGISDGSFISPQGQTVKGAIGQGVRDAFEGSSGRSIVDQAKARASSHVTREAKETIQYEQQSWNMHTFGATHDLIKYHEYGTGTRAEDKERATINAPDGDGYVIPLEGYDSLPFGPGAVKQMEELDFRFVVHPGVEGKHFMRDALRGNTWLIEEKVAERLDDLRIDV